MKKLITLLLMLVLSIGLSSQTKITGNSLVQLAPWTSIGIPLTEIRGHNSYTCSMLSILLPYDVPLGTQVAVLVESTNDIRTNVPLAAHMACITGEITYLQSHRSGIKLFIVNTPPWNQINCYGDQRDLISQYNNAYLSLPDQYGVTVVDVWTGAVQSDNWAIPELMSGPCGVHPGQNQTPNAGWTFFMSQIVNAMSAHK
jgi:hypothetical protein